MKCLCAAARQSARVVTRFYEQELQTVDMTPAQFELLQNFSGKPQTEQSELVTRLGIDQTTLSRNISVLIDRGWIKRTASMKDQRRMAYALTREGRNILAAALPHWKRAQTRMQAALGSDWESVLSSLERLNQLTPR